MWYSRTAVCTRIRQIPAMTKSAGQLDVSESRSLIRFGEFEYDGAKRELRKNGIRVRLQKQPLAILLALTESPGDLVTREELRRRIWSSGTYVSFEQGLNS